jgi:hypothetical protein
MRTDGMKLIVPFRNFANMPEKGMTDLHGNEIDILGIKYAGIHLY